MRARQKIAKSLVISRIRVQRRAMGCRLRLQISRRNDQNRKSRGDHSCRSHVQRKCETLIGRREGFLGHSFATGERVQRRPREIFFSLSSHADGIDVRDRHREADIRSPQSSN